ncbi:MAG: galactonate dehydratase [Anaerolineae bacterium]|jgi:galactonate dehydratase
MRIVAVDTLAVKPRWLLVKVTTDEGIVGWGEATLEGHIPAVAAEIGHWRDRLLGEDPRRIQHLWQRMYRHAFYRGGPIQCSAISGLEQALWDIVGRWLDVPVHAMLGGAVRERIRLYRHVGGDTPEALAQAGREAVAQGFTAVKTGGPDPGRGPVEPPEVIRRLAERIEALREAVGPGVSIGVDLHGRTSPALAIRIARALEPYDLAFIEEPCLPESVEALAEVARSTSIPIATGERLYTKWGFRDVLAQRAAAILQPDLSHAGGILECRFIAAMAEAHFVAVAPHCPLGPVALAACLQLDACIPNFALQEHVTLGQGYLKTPFVLEEGCVRVPQGPGLGIEVNEEGLAEYADEGLWCNPAAYDEDGCVSEW